MGNVFLTTIPKNGNLKREHFRQFGIAKPPFSVISKIPEWDKSFAKDLPAIFSEILQLRCAQLQNDNHGYFVMQSRQSL